MDSSASGGSGASAPVVSNRVDPLLPSRAERDRKRLTRRILGGAVIVALAIVGLAAMMLWRLQDAQLQDGLGDVSSLDLLVAAQTERAFESVGVVLDDVSADLQAQNIASPAALRQAAGDEGTFRLLRAKMAGIGQLDAIAIATSEGDVVNRTRSYPVTPQVNVANRDYFARLRDHPELKIYISPPLQSADGKTMVFVGKRLNAPNGAFLGIVLGAIHATYFEDLYTNYLRALPGQGGSMALWRKDGTLLARSPIEPDAAIDTVPPDLTRPMPNNGLLSYWTVDAHGGTLAVAQRRLDDLPLVIEVRQSASAMLAPWNSEFLATGFGGGALLLLVGVAVGLLLRQLRTQALIIEERARANREAEARGDIERARTEAETAMRDAQQSESRFRDIAEVGSDWIWETDATHRFTMIAGARQPKVSLIGKTRWEQAGVIEPETDQHWREHKVVLDAHQPFRQFRFSMQLPDGRFHVCVSGKPIFAEDGDFLGYRGTVSDETELVETRERAARADALLRNAIDSIAEGFVIFDADDRFVMCNEAYRKMYPQNAAGFTPGARFEEIMRAAVATGRYPDALGREDEWLAEHVRQHREGSALEENQLGDGRWVLHSERRMPDGGIAGLRIDITAVKAAQESLRESQVMLNRAQKLSATGSVVRNLQTKVTEWSDEMYRIFGVERGVFQPRTDLFLAMIHPEDRARVEQLIRPRADKQGEPPAEFRIIRPDGTMRWVYREADFWRDPDGKSSGMRLTTYKDITEKREADIRHRELETLLRDAIESISEGFVIYDKDDRLVICNEGYRRIYPEIADIIAPGIHFGDLLRAQLARGHRPEMKGREEEWIADMLRRRRASAEPHEVKMHNDRWVLVFERRMSNGGLAGLRVDITELKAAQESLRESQAMLNRAQRLSATGSAVRNLKTGSVEWSDEMYRIFGLDRDNVTAGTSEFRSYIHPEDRDQVPSAREVAQDGQTVAPVEFRIVRPDGTVRWIYREIELVRDGGEVTSILSTYKDITEQREADTQRRQLEVLLCDAIESISEGFVIYDADDRLVLCNEAFRKLYPLSADRMVPGTRYEDILRGAAYEHLSLEPESAEEWLAQRLRQHRELKEPVELQLQDGRWLFISERRTSSGGTAGLRVDITAMKRVQQSLRESQQRLDRTQQIAHIGTVERDVRHNTVVWSDETYRIFGVSPESYTPGFENLLGFVHPEDRERVLRVFRQHDSEHLHSSLTYRIIRPSGETRVVFCQADTTFDQADKPLYISIAMMDITEKELASQRQIELEAQLRHSEKLTALGTLAGGIAHDLNNTLVPIQALSKLVMREFLENASARGDLEMIYQASIQARDLVRQILAFSRKQDMLNEPTDIAVRVQEALQMLRASVPSTIEIVERITPMEPILGDGTQLQQVIVNLVANSAHAIGDGCGRVTVTLDEVPGDAETPRFVRLSVADTGSGMSPEVMHRMFEPFFTTKSVGEGTGLGLSVVHGIVTGHGGTIDVKSTPGQGTEFIILLPARPVDESSAIAAVA